MSVDAIQPALCLQTGHPEQDGAGQNSQGRHRNDKPEKLEPESPGQPQVFLNTLGQTTGMTINITA